MNLKEIKLTNNDKNLLKFLARFKLMLASDAIFFYNSSYYQKRLQELKNANYITRFYRIYIRLTPAGIRYLENNNIKCETPCRSRNYIDRLILVSKIGIRLINTNIQFEVSWKMKGNNYTDWSKRFLGEIELRNEKYLMYYAKDNKKYVRYLHFDINKDLSYQNVLVIVDSFEIIDEKNPFIFNNKTSCLIMKKERINNLPYFNKLNIKQKIEQIYNKEVEYADFNSADFKIDNVNIVYMPYIDTHRISAINSFYSLGFAESKTEIVSFKENISHIKRLLNKEVNEKCSFKQIEEEKWNE